MFSGLTNSVQRSYRCRGLTDHIMYLAPSWQKAVHEYFNVCFVCWLDMVHVYSECGGRNDEFRCLWGALDGQHSSAALCTPGLATGGYRRGQGCGHMAYLDTTRVPVLCNITCTISLFRSIWPPRGRGEGGELQSIMLLHDLQNPPHTWMQFA